MILFLDLETTGLESTDKIISIGVIGVKEDFIHVEYDLVNEGKKIPPKASSINHITNEMIQSKPKFQECAAYKFLSQYNEPSTTLVAHNAQFDLKMLLASGFDFKGDVVDTLRVSKHLIPECEGYSLQFLRYELRLYKSQNAQALLCGVKEALLAHHALHDALMVKMLYQYLLEMQTTATMIELSSKNVLMQKLEFGKYKGRYIEEISLLERGYLEWMLVNILDLNEDLKYSINHYLQGNT